jgi:hypothetical protein
MQALQLHGKIVFSFHANNDEINEPALITVHLPFSPTRVPQEIGNNSTFVQNETRQKLH